jgi:hypothetical protein
VSPSHVAALPHASSFAATADTPTFVDYLTPTPTTSIHRQSSAAFSFLLMNIKGIRYAKF